MVKEGQEFGNNLGNFMALLSGFCFAAMLIMARKSGKKDVLGGTFIGGFFSGIFGFFDTNNSDVFCDLGKYSETRGKEA